MASAPSPSASPSASASKGSSGKGAQQKVPQLSFSTKPFGVPKTEDKVVKKGKGAAVKEGQLVTFNFAVANGKNGKQLESTFGKQPITIQLDSQHVMPGLIKGLAGHHAGDRVVVAIPPKDAFGSKGNPQLGIGGNDTMVWLVDLKSSQNLLKHAQGTAVAPKPGLPKVAYHDGKAATITVPKGKQPPKSLVVQPLVKGKGQVVKAGETVSVNYTGVIWRNGKKFDSNFDHGGAPASFPIGVGRVIPGWDKGLVGQRVGSRLLLVVPPNDGYGKKGQPQAGIKGTDTLVFVVDILGTTTQ
ncbi:MAG TPA: FKBP-type peptidyl-prolyl cis-trans isomerase [Segeticoccus sp.]|uniref:FKBP-type peptidyl-prolyl cis-trans isomerase n=1 Tax=Segeticoccus sp. TaxID=2706531 RepID=UPI002D8057B1|nr:FKBP-type peptidyl-prolyl cis-trans isomerase [Segeticoccus sp.]HET8598948.1 FKBP-type peptidyl-prolyl cis-trans isomerase [Segeticoccus sp.]